MAFTNSEFTTVNYIKVDLGTNKIMLLVNSYKNGDIEVTITNPKNDFSIDIPISCFDLKHIKSKILDHGIMTVVKNYYDNSLNVFNNSKLIKDIPRVLARLIDEAAKFNGRPTKDYSQHLCHAKLVLGNKKD